MGSARTVRRPRAGAPPGGAMRMAELILRSGVPRETIHFYLREGLLPRPRKGGRTVAWYGAEHLERLQLIRRLREEKYLPLAVIRRLLDAPAAAAQDVDALAEVMGLVHGPPDGPGPSDAALGEALRRGLLGPAVRDAPGRSAGAATQRVLHLVDEVLSLEGPARELTLADLQVCADELHRLVGREAAVFFERVFASADVPGSIAALRAGRGAVARFVGAFRDLMLERIVDELLTAVQRGPDVVAKAATVPLSPARERALGTLERRAALRGGLTPLTPTAARAFVWHLFACGASGELGALAPEVVAAAGPRCAVLCAWGAYEAAKSPMGLKVLESAASLAPGFALGSILAGEAMLARGLGRPSADAGLLERAVPALHRLLGADPEADDEPLARLFGAFHRGRVELALPAVVGRGDAGARTLEGVLEAVRSADPALEPAGRERVRLNASLALGRHLARRDPGRARALLEEAAGVDPLGPAGEVAQAELACLASGSPPVTAPRE